MKTEANAPIGVIDGLYGADAMSSGNTGLTKREYFADNAQVSHEDLVGFAEVIMGYTPAADKKERLQYWLDAEARYKVMKADALITALNGKEVKNG